MSEIVIFEIIRIHFVYADNTLELCSVKFQIGLKWSVTIKVKEYGTNEISADSGNAYGLFL